MEESEISRAVAETAAAALNEETDRWLPKARGLPAVGQRVRLIGTHPWARYTGIVLRHEQFLWGTSCQMAALVELADTHGRLAQIFGPQDWEALE